LCALGKLGVVVQKEEEGEREKGKGQREIRERGEWRYVTVTETALKEDAAAIAQVIEQEVERLGGLSGG
jgi:hypothetical protein